jgi:hypothetical protein
MGVEYILKNSLLRRTLDNVTVVLIAFSNFKHAAFGKSDKSSRPTETETKFENEEKTSPRLMDKVENKRKENIPP